MTDPVQPYRRLIAALFGTLKLVQMYGKTHDATVEGLRNLTEAIRGAQQDGETRVSVRGSRVQVNGRPMRSSECGNLALAFLTAEWNRRSIEAVRFRKEVTSVELATFAGLFLELDLGEAEPGERLARACREANLERVHVEARIEHEEEPVLLDDQRQDSMRVYLRGLRAFKEVLRYDGLSDKRNLRRARRAVQGLVDRFLEDENAVLALAQIRGHDIKLFRHSLNVCVYSLLLGQRLGMGRRRLGELGLAALFHDLGKVAGDPGEETTPARRRERVREHPVRGACMLLHEGTSHEGMLKAAIGAYEHHVHFDGGGFPEIDHETHLVSRIVAIADCYEALTASRGQGGPSHAAYDALALMQDKAGTIFDPLLIKVFANALGVYPVGSLVELSSGEVAIVCARPSLEEQLGHPRVRIVSSATGPLEPGIVVDLCEQDEQGAFRRSIARTLAPEDVFASVSEYVSAI